MEKCNRILDSMSVEYLSQAILNQSPECGDNTLYESFDLCFRFSQVHTGSKDMDFLSKPLLYQNSMLGPRASCILWCSRVYFVKDPKDRDGGFSNRKRANQKNSILNYVIHFSMNHLELFPVNLAMFPRS